MRAYQFDSVTGALKLSDLPTPTPKPGEILIRVVAAGATPSELVWYPTTHTKAGGVRSSAVPGHEFSGTVAAVGIEVDSFAVGSDVFGMNDWFADGATADYCITRPEWIATKPPSVSHYEASAAPIGALTAWQGLFDRAALRTGERILVHGGSGSVGSFAVQLACQAGAHVVASASARNQGFLREIGGDTTIDYNQPAAPPGPFDVIFDTVGGDTLARSWALLKPGGRMITIAADVEATTDERAKAAFFIVEPNGEQLAKIAALLEAHKLVATVNAIVPFAQADEVYRRKIVGSGRGKVVIDVASR